MVLDRSDELETEKIAIPDDGAGDVGYSQRDVVCNSVMHCEAVAISIPGSRRSSHAHLVRWLPQDLTLVVQIAKQTDLGHIIPCRDL